MGKSFLAKTVMESEYGAVYRQVDKIYTVAVNYARMVAVGASGADSREERRRDEKDARRDARDRKWPDTEARARFFRSYEKQIRRALREAVDRDAPVVLEGGSLRTGEEADIIAGCAGEICGPEALVVRVTVEVPYDRWLQNRVHRMLKSEVPTAAMSKFSRETYASEAEAATPAPNANVIDCKIHDVDGLRALMRQLDRTPHDGRNGRADGMLHGPGDRETARSGAVDKSPESLPVFMSRDPPGWLAALHRERAAERLRRRTARRTAAVALVSVAALLTGVALVLTPLT